MRYADFGSRFGANLIDGLIFLPLTFGAIWMRAQSTPLAVASLIVTLLFAIYQLYFIAAKGQTLGKMFAEIKVTKLDGSPVGWRESFLRESVNLLFWFLITLSTLIALWRISPIEYASVSTAQQSLLITRHQPIPINFIAVLSQLWFWSELVVLLTNKQRRALHDFMAGTVVLNVGKPEEPTPLVDFEQGV